MHIKLDIRQPAPLTSPKPAVTEPNYPSKKLYPNLPVPLIYVGDKSLKAVEGGKLSDIAPTMLSLMGMPIPEEMTGKPLFIVE